MKTLAFAAFTLVAALALVAHAGPPPPPEKPYLPGPRDIVILYEHDNFGGRAVPITQNTLDLRTVNFNDQASSFKVRMGYQVTFYEDIDGKGEWFTFNCPSKPIGIKQSDFCELKSIGNDIATGMLCEIRPKDSPGCVSWWNDRISGLGDFKPADESVPQGRTNQGHNG